MESTEPRGFIGLGTGESPDQFVRGTCSAEHGLPERNGSTVGDAGLFDVVVRLEADISPLTPPLSSRNLRRNGDADLMITSMLDGGSWPVNRRFRFSQEELARLTSDSREPTDLLNNRSSHPYRGETGFCFGLSPEGSSKSQWLRCASELPSRATR